MLNVLEDWHMKRRTKKMSDYNWCHNPSCHKIETQSRVRGTGDNKVLRTRKIKVYNPNDLGVWDYFCNQNCLFGFISHYLNEMVNINPVRKPSETPIKVEVKTHDFGYMEGRTYKVITPIDNA